MASRKDRRNRKSSRKNRRMCGGNPAPVDDQSMALPMQNSLKQGAQYANIHKDQHGGYLSTTTQTPPPPPPRGGYYEEDKGSPVYKAENTPEVPQQGGALGAYPNAVVNSVLPSNLTASARVGPLDAAIAGIQGMQDGGRRYNRKMNRKTNRKTNRKMNRKISRKTSRKTSRRNRVFNVRGGAASPLTSSPISESSMLLPPDLQKQASLNYEWSLANDPKAFAPKP
jgi:hypothetical protein